MSKTSTTRQRPALAPLDIRVSYVDPTPEQLERQARLVLRLLSQPAATPAPESEAA